MNFDLCPNGRKGRGYNVLAKRAINKKYYVVKLL
jgi:hypothetical protein